MRAARAWRRGSKSEHGPKTVRHELIWQLGEAQPNDLRDRWPRLPLLISLRPHSRCHKIRVGGAYEL